LLHSGTADKLLHVRQQLFLELTVTYNDMKTLLIAALCSAAILASGCATSHSSAGAWEYKSATTYPEAAGDTATRLGKEGWRFVSMSAFSKAPGETPTVVLLFKKHK
jgi:hypothetical protein